MMVWHGALALAALVVSVSAVDGTYCKNAASIDTSTAGSITCTWAAGTAGTFTTPPMSVTSLGLALLGGAGGNSYPIGMSDTSPGTTHAGGAGAAFTVASFATLPGDQYDIYVGVNGNPGLKGDDQPGAAGAFSVWPSSAYAGGAGGNGAGSGAVGGSSGGSATGLTSGSGSLLFLAGAGGGASFTAGQLPNSDGGSAGQPGQPGGNGPTVSNGAAAGQGGSSDGSTGGQGGAVAANGQPGQDGGSQTTSPRGYGGKGGDATANEGAPGGGAGYAGGGGGGGGDTASGAGGGSSFAISGAVTAVTNDPTTSPPAPFLSITYAAGPTISGKPANARRRLHTRRVAALAKLLEERARAGRPIYVY